MWQGSFFYYFVATWIMLNVWAIYGLAAYYGQNGNTGADPTSLSTFIVVNLQTMQLLIQVRMWADPGSWFPVLSHASCIAILDLNCGRFPPDIPHVCSTVLPRDDGGAAPGLA